MTFQAKGITSFAPSVFLIGAAPLAGEAPLGVATAPLAFFSLSGAAGLSLPAVTSGAATTVALPLSSESVFAGSTATGSFPDGFFVLGTLTCPHESLAIVAASGSPH
jgi:hypothetical protein